MFNFSIVKLLDYQWEDLERSQNVFAIVVMAHLKTKETTSNLSEREQWKWNLSRLLYEKGYSRKEIVDLYKVIDIMMALPVELQASFEEKLTNYQEDKKVPLLSNIEIRAIERTRREDIIKLLQKRFGNLSESLVENINQIDDIAVLDSLVVETIGVNSPEDFQRIIDSQLRKNG